MSSPKSLTAASSLNAPRSPWKATLGRRAGVMIAPFGGAVSSPISGQFSLLALQSQPQAIKASTRQSNSGFQFAGGPVGVREAPAHLAATIRSERKRTGFHHI